MESRIAEWSRCLVRAPLGRGSPPAPERDHVVRMRCPFAISILVEEGEVFGEESTVWALGAGLGWNSLSLLSSACLLNEAV